MTDFERAFAAKLKELIPALYEVRSRYTRRTGIDCEMHFDAIVGDIRYIIFMEFWDNGIIHFSVEDDQDRILRSKNHNIADPAFSVELFAADLQTIIDGMPKLPIAYYEGFKDFKS